MSNILLVDDNPQNLATLTRILTEHGYRVRTAINGQVALKSVQNMAPDLILLDIRMPGMDGYEVCREVKKDTATQDIPVLFLSALDDPVDKVKAFDAGGVDYITKPFQTDEVVARVETHLTLRMMQQQLQSQNQELATYRDHLQELVNERTQELSQTNTRLQDEITERTRIEQVLRVSEKQYRLLAEHVKDGIVIIQQGRIVFVNAGFALMVGRPKEQLLQLEPSALFPEEMEQRVQNWLHSEESAASTAEWEVELLTSEEQSLWVEMEQSHILWNSQSALLLTVRDIHQSKLREIRLEQERARLHQENLTFKTTLMERYRFGSLIGKSPAMQRVYELIVSAAASDVNVLIVGESGTGKELIARTLYQVSSRKSRSFVPVNCASIPDTLFEREFFGHRKGAFTGADRDKPGFFDQAHQGVLFLDEVTELSPGMQAKLLRVLQDGEYLPLGSTVVKQADTLLVTATNKDWQELIEHGGLRKDFFYRVCVLEIRVPPLRERKEDIPLLVDHFLEQYRRKQQQRQEEYVEIPNILPGHIMEAFYAYNWPGNVRELQNVLQRYLVTQHLDGNLPLLAEIPPKSRTVIEIPMNPAGLPLPDAVKTYEKQVIVETLEKNHYHKINTAKMLGIPRSTLHRKIKEYQI
ncbi:PAS modulated sigma54 specific transcriptional regulator, Fis family [Candidatus Vecturithrix granuli]|uniref:PAS modulated sigma54 specific transcriptional regulator, Fis family n=1 Tax=Vecturithrix granuli TaxID=1499967 RepID=A0A0S6WA63_VECG1|nr:PAS modulated sigma54 specific transcriptional regulator, Fis family [Candidatus Vecturithrix granuli]